MDLADSQQHLHIAKPLILNHYFSTVRDVLPAVLHMNYGTQLCCESDYLFENPCEKVGQRGGEKMGFTGYSPLSQLHIHVLHINEIVGGKQGVTYSRFV